ncbi:hypothetical protein C8F04DRAFT_1281231 [Mycena alexandri]|uniref:Uncharacterized protein n=1 Tax=Mycena alexandri TaxID=1745969 RepID=A0AAD6WK79_9AGAR|nr:hypothetical protein C8F04DRAFT_1281231 [Mycena alexandri]
MLSPISLSTTSPVRVDDIAFRKDFDIVFPESVPPARAACAVEHGLWRVIRRIHGLPVSTCTRRSRGGSLSTIHTFALSLSFTLSSAPSTSPTPALLSVAARSFYGLHAADLPRSRAWCVTLHSTRHRLLVSACTAPLLPADVGLDIGLDAC